MIQSDSGKPPFDIIYLLYYAFRQGGEKKNEKQIIKGHTLRVSMWKVACVWSFLTRDLCVVSDGPQSQE